MKTLRALFDSTFKIKDFSKRLDQIVTMILYLVLIAISLFPSASWGNIALCGLFIVLRTFRRRTSKPVKTLWNFGQVFLEFVLIILLLYPRTSDFENIVFMIFVFELVLNYPVMFSVPFTYFGFLTYLVIWRGSELVFFQYILEMINFSFYIIALATSKVLLQQQRQILALNDKILMQSKLIEETTALKERNRIAEEMHDTIGHTLTASIVSLEGVELLLVKSPQDALALLSKSKKLLKESLSDVRETVRNLKDHMDPSGLTLELKIKNLIAESVSHSSPTITFNYYLEGTPAPLYDYVIFNTIREALTNVLRHSQANLVTIDLEAQGGFILLTVANDGDAEASITYSFGLNTMQSRLKALGGTLSLTNNDAKGITLVAQIPIAYDLEDGHGEN